MDLKDTFFQSYNFEKLRIVKNLEVLTIKLVETFENEGFKFYPKWRETHSSGNQKNFNFKVKHKADRFENIITIYPMNGWLKVEVYRGQYNKTHYIVGVETINSTNYMKTLIEDAKDIYNTLSALKI